MREYVHMTGLAIAVVGLAFFAVTIPTLPAESSTYEKAAYAPAKNKGNLRKQGNYWSKGRAINSGNFVNVVDSYKTNNSFSGSANIVNGPQRVIVRRR